MVEGMRYYVGRTRTFFMALFSFLYSLIQNNNKKKKLNNIKFFFSKNKLKQHHFIINPQGTF